MNQMLSVDEAVQAAISELEEYTGWKYLKSQRCLKKKVKDIEITSIYEFGETIVMCFAELSAASRLS